MHFVFGVPAHDLPGEYALELLHSKKKNAYFLSVETAYYFQSKSDEIRYYTRLLDEFTDYMEQSKLDTNAPISLNDICHWNAKEFDTIERAYAWFKFMVESYTYMYR